MRKREEAVYIISVAAELAGVHPQTLRIYERKGLIEPYRTPGGTRRYSDEDLERLSLIQQLTAAGVNLEGVRRILGLREENKRLRSQVDRLRRLLGEAEARVAGRGPMGVIRSVRITERRNLPDIPRENPFG
ncbi:MAG TPA: helix-turn-helix transcriptional regulator [Acidimicrobiia bacterium]|jgi:MerR family transcriptional regulator/heat shock protein HspR|nr:helix-turn-helix transcriptional regulator [Acidimicrobiia bacterium]